METYLIVGLGNPGMKYANTRHNAGFNSIDRLANDILRVSVSSDQFKAHVGTAIYNGMKLILMKPQTYMNLSGEAVAPAAAYYKIDPQHVIVLCDDINFNCGVMRLRGKGSAGGHNGLKSIIAQLGSDEFRRIRIGVGAKLPEQDLANHVLGQFGPDDRVIMNRIYDEAAKAALCIVDEGIDKAMNKYNGVRFGVSEEEKK